MQEEYSVNSSSAMKGKQDLGRLVIKRNVICHGMEFPCIFASEKKSDLLWMELCLKSRNNSEEWSDNEPWTQ